MYLCIYKKKNKLYFNSCKKLTERFNVINENLEVVKLSYRNKIDSYRINDFDDLKKFRSTLAKKYAMRILIVENRFEDKIQWKLVIYLLNNLFYDIGIAEREVEKLPEETKYPITRSYELKRKSDIEKASEELGFDIPDNFPDIFDY